MTRGARSKARLLELAREWEAEAAANDARHGAAHMEVIGTTEIAAYRRRIAAHCRALAGHLQDVAR